LVADCLTTRSIATIVMPLECDKRGFPYSLLSCNDDPPFEYNVCCDESTDQPTTSTTAIANQIGGSLLVASKID
jgi:hypothetical protein